MFRLEVNSLVVEIAADYSRIRGGACAKPLTIVLVLILEKGCTRVTCRLSKRVLLGHTWWGEAPELPEVLPEVPGAELRHHTPGTEKRADLSDEATPRKASLRANRWRSRSRGPACKQIENENDDERFQLIDTAP